MSSRKFRFTNTFIKFLMSLMVRTDLAQLAKVPKAGPLILVSNHINFMEIPIVFTHLQPRPVTGFVKSETWDNPFLGWLFSLWGGIPLRRGEADLAALKKGVEMLQKGYILGISPEGTRTGTGVLRRGLPGVTILAMHSGAPLQPLVYFGHEDYKNSLKRLKRVDFHVVAGRIFCLKQPEGSLTREIRQDMTDEIMYQLALLLPEKYRGEYADLSKATTKYLSFST